MSTHETVIEGDRIFEIVDRGDKFAINWVWMEDANVCGVISGLYPTVEAAQGVLAGFIKTR